MTRLRHMTHWMRHVTDELHTHTHQLENIMSNQDRLNEAATAIGTQLDEVIAEIAALKAANVDLDFTALDAAVQRVADVVPTAEPPVDPPVE